MTNPSIDGGRPADGFLGRPRRILLADDDGDIRLELAKALGEDGFLVVEAADGNELLELIVKAVADPSARTFYDAIITDVMMP